MNQGETNLDQLLANMDPKLDSDIYVFTTLPPSTLESIPLSLLQPRMIFHEVEGCTLIITMEQAQKYNLLPDQPYPCRCITLNVHSSLDAVGFLARISTHLATTMDLSVNVVSAYYHDHLFVPADRVQDAMTGLRQLIQMYQEKVSN
jgi:uncharacterized protein